MQIFDLMAAFIECRESVIEAYQVDFYKYDKEILESSIHAGMRYLWVVKKYGTHLVPLGLHRRNQECIVAVLNTEGPHQCFEVSITSNEGAGRLKSITIGEARDLAKVKTFEQRDGLIYRGKQVVAGYDCKLERRENHLVATVSYLSGNYQPDAFEKHVLKCIAGNVASTEAQTLFVSLADATLDRVSLFATDSQPQGAVDLFGQAA